MESLKDVCNLIKEIETKITDQEYKGIQDLLKKIYDEKSACVYEVKYVDCMNSISVEDDEMYTNCHKENRTIYMKVCDKPCGFCYSHFKNGEITQCMLNRYMEDGYLIINDNHSEIEGTMGFIKTLFIISMKKLN